MCTVAICLRCPQIASFKISNFKIFKLEKALHREGEPPSYSPRSVASLTRPRYYKSHTHFHLLGLAGLSLFYLYYCYITVTIDTPLYYTERPSRLIP